MNLLPQDALSFVHKLPKIFVATVEPRIVDLSVDKREERTHVGKDVGTNFDSNFDGVGDGTRSESE